MYLCNLSSLNRKPLLKSTMLTKYRGSIGESKSSIQNLGSKILTSGTYANDPSSQSLTIKIDSTTRPISAG